MAGEQPDKNQEEPVAVGPKGKQSCIADKDVQSEQ